MLQVVFLRKLIFLANYVAVDFLTTLEVILSLPNFDCFLELLALEDDWLSPFQHLELDDGVLAACKIYGGQICGEAILKFLVDSIGESQRVVQPFERE